MVVVGRRWKRETLTLTLFQRELCIITPSCTITRSAKSMSVMNSLKTITIPIIPDASLMLASKLKERLGWLDAPEEIQQILAEVRIQKWLSIFVPNLCSP